MFEDAPPAERPGGRWRRCRRRPGHAAPRYDFETAAERCVRCTWCYRHWSHGGWEFAATDDEAIEELHVMMLNNSTPAGKPYETGIVTQDGRLKVTLKKSQGEVVVAMSGPSAPRDPRASDVAADAADARRRRQQQRRRRDARGGWASEPGSRLRHRTTPTAAMGVSLPPLGEVWDAWEALRRPRSSSWSTAWRVALGFGREAAGAVARGERGADARRRRQGRLSGRLQVSSSCCPSHGTGSASTTRRRCARWRR